MQGLQSPDAAAAAAAGLLQESDHHAQSFRFHSVAGAAGDDDGFRYNSGQPRHNDIQFNLSTLHNASNDDMGGLKGGGMVIDDFYIILYIFVVPIVFALIVFFGTVGNSLVIFVILSKKKLQTVTNLLLLNLAVADISFLVVCGTFVTLHYALTVWPFGDTMCRIVQFLLYVTCYVTVYTLIAVSAVRYITVVHGPQSALIKSKRNILLLIFTIWFVFLLAKIPVLIVHGVSHNEKNNRTECIISGKEEAQNLFASFFVFAYALPLLLIITLYLGILCHLKKKKEQSTTHPPNEGERTKHVTKIVVLVVTVFAVCWLPLHIHLLVANYGQIPASQAYYACLVLWHSLAFGNSILNPIIYNIFSSDFRNGFREVVCCRRESVASPPPPVDV